MAVTIKCNPRNLCVINTYMPTRGPDSAKDYEDCLDQLREIVIKYQDNHTLILCGDLNGHPTKNVTGHDRLLASFCRDLRMELPHSYYQGDSYVHKGGMGLVKDRPYTCLI